MSNIQHGVGEEHRRMKMDVMPGKPFEWVWEPGLRVADPPGCVHEVPGGGVGDAVYQRGPFNGIGDVTEIGLDPIPCQLFEGFLPVVNCHYPGSVCQQFGTNSGSD